MIEKVIKKLFGSRKFTIVILVTVLLCVGQVTEWVWFSLTAVYLGVNVAQKFGRRPAPPEGMP